MKLLVAILLVGCGGDDGGGGIPGDSTAHEFCVQETNRYRTGGGRAAVTRSMQLEDFADMGAQIDHAGTPHDHFRQTNGGGIAFAENECPHWSLSAFGNGDMKMLVAECIAAFYDEGPGGGHYDNMMGSYGSLGCGIYQAGDDVTILQDFGR